MVSIKMLEKFLRLFFKFSYSVVKCQAMQGLKCFIKLVIPGQSQQRRVGCHYFSIHIWRVRLATTNSAIIGETEEVPIAPPRRIWFKLSMMIKPRPAEFKLEIQEASE